MLQTQLFQNRGLACELGRCPTWAPWSTMASCAFPAWVEKGMTYLKLRDKRLALFRRSQVKEDISGRSRHYCITKFCRPQNWRWAIKSHYTWAQTAKKILRQSLTFPIGWASLFCFPRVYRFSSHWSSTLTRSWQATLGMRTEVICTRIKSKHFTWKNFFKVELPIFGSMN